VIGRGGPLPRNARLVYGGILRIIRERTAPLTLALSPAELAEGEGVVDGSLVPEGERASVRGCTRRQKRLRKHSTPEAASGDGVPHSRWWSRGVSS
jgi:hypothetical protein